MSCQPFTSIPQPPTTLPSCAVPVGGSNSSILDACCNGHINAIATYSASDSPTIIVSSSLSPAASSTPIVNSEDDDGCFQYCITDSPDIVQSCLAEKMSAYKESQTTYGCFNADKAARRARGSDEGYVSAGTKIGGCAEWAVRLLLGVGVVGALMGSI
ncbi:hypothetical protein BDW02DRAFT_503764 [Decorospora gaudefroyi]|uniref:Uncharacterized protein n=1 Tax=Decorospora gaudefroyi TaxID=184978 RepID=A0A6A5K7U7_9PLEO|nr:hypothetical protein BDW02DRAFT_503764 [Decorospora gaudefroyi]